MQEDGKLLSHGLALRRHSLLEKIVLNVMGQLAPIPRNSVAQSAKDLCFGLSGNGIQRGYSRLLIKRDSNEKLRGRQGANNIFRLAIDSFDDTRTVNSLVGQK